jgi:molybdate transport system substrate-binding protein
MRRVLAQFCAALLLLIAGPAPVRANTVTVFAAASLKTALDQVAADWTATTGQTVVLSYAATSALARQIEAGAPADIFFAASEDWMDDLEDKGLVQAGSRRDVLGNVLVLIAPAPAPSVDLASVDLAALLGDGPLAMAGEAVPAGIYGRAALSSMGLWDGVATRVAQTDNVRGALALVALGEAQLGVVYASDAMAEPRVSVIATFPKDSHPPIVYPAALTAAATGPAPAAFLDYLSGPGALAVFVANGFVAVSP